MMNPDESRLQTSGVSSSEVIDKRKDLDSPCGITLTMGISMAVYTGGKLFASTRCIFANSIRKAISMRFSPSTRHWTRLHKNITRLIEKENSNPN